MKQQWQHVPRPSQPPSSNFEYLSLLSFNSLLLIVTVRVLVSFFCYFLISSPQRAVPAIMPIDENIFAIPL